MATFADQHWVGAAMLQPIFTYARASARQRGARSRIARYSSRWFRKCKNSFRRMNSAPNFFVRRRRRAAVRICLVRRSMGAARPRSLEGSLEACTHPQCA